MEGEASVASRPPATPPPTPPSIIPPHTHTVRVAFEAMQLVVVVVVCVCVCVWGGLKLYSAEFRLNRHLTTFFLRGSSLIAGRQAGQGAEARRQLGNCFVSNFSPT